MNQTVERLDLPAETYQALERIASKQGVTPLRVIETWVQQHQVTESLRALRQEYQHLIDKDLAHTLTEQEEERLDVVCTQINVIEMQSEASQIWQQRAETIDARLEELKRTLSAFPARQGQVE